MIRDKEIICESDSFEFCKVSGTGINNTPYEEYRVFTKRASVMYSYAIEIRLISSQETFKGTPVFQKPLEVYIAYGLLSSVTSSISEFCKCLQEASDFAMKVCHELQIPFINR